MDSELINSSTSLSNPTNFDSAKEESILSNAYTLENTMSGAVPSSDCYIDLPAPTARWNDQSRLNSHVQFSTVVKACEETPLKKKKMSFRDVNVKDVLASVKLHNDMGGTPPKSILKSRGEQVLQPHYFDKESLNFVNKAFDGDVEVESIPTAKPIIRGSTSSQTSNPALADLVGLIIKRTSMDIDGRDAHPFGRDCSIEGILSGSRPQSHSKNSAFGKLVVWITLVCILLGSACGIIFLSETYNASLRQQARVDSLTSNATGSLTK